MKYAHTNIAAHDWKGLAEFYCAVFDCKIKPPEREYSGAWLDRATGLTQARLEGVHLILPGYGEDGPTLEIFTYDDMVETTSTMANHQGFTHIAFEVENVYQTYETALQHGGQVMGEVTEREVPGIGLLFISGISIATMPRLRDSTAFVRLRIGPVTRPARNNAVKITTTAVTESKMIPFLRALIRSENGSLYSRSTITVQPYFVLPLWATIRLPS